MEPLRCAVFNLEDFDIDLISLLPDEQIFESTDQLDVEDIEEYILEEGDLNTIMELL